MPTTTTTTTPAEIILKSLKNGERGERGKTFSSRCPNDYTVLRNGSPCGFVYRGWGGDTRWVAVVDGIKTSVRCEYLRDVPAAIASAIGS
jgi:hypothetical protein